MPLKLVLYMSIVVLFFLLQAFIFFFNFEVVGSRTPSTPSGYAHASTLEYIQ